MSEPIVLLVEDEPQIRRFVRAALESDGCRVFEAETAGRGLIEAGTRKPDLVVLDLGLPDKDGVAFIRDLRGWSSVSVIVLSARADEQGKIDALDAGADDYLTKPFSVGEFLARVRAMLRRRTHPENSSPVLVFGEISMDMVNHVITRRGEEIHLTPIEYRLLSHLVINAGKVLTHRQILREVWGPSHVESTHYLRVYMRSLRMKLEVDPARPDHFLTESGLGYRFKSQ